MPVRVGVASRLARARAWPRRRSRRELRGRRNRTRPERVWPATRRGRAHWAHFENAANAALDPVPAVFEPASGPIQPIAALRSLLNSASARADVEVPAVVSCQVRDQGTLACERLHRDFQPVLGSRAAQLAFPWAAHGERIERVFVAGLSRVCGTKQHTHPGARAPKSDSERGTG